MVQNLKGLNRVMMNQRSKKKLIP